ncbi:hypothetical protein ACS0TY_030009 [Phlomoides rotata]
MKPICRYVSRNNLQRILQQSEPIDQKLKLLAPFSPIFVSRRGRGRRGRGN